VISGAGPADEPACGGVCAKHTAGTTKMIKIDSTRRDRFKMFSERDFRQFDSANRYLKR